jgi:hypothetical protein
MFQSKQSELVKAVEPLGLKELTLPPYKLKDTILTPINKMGIIGR